MPALGSGAAEEAVLQQRSGGRERVLMFGKSRLVRGLAAVGAGALILAACSSSTKPPSTSSSSSSSTTSTTVAGKPLSGGVVKFSESPAANPTYIFPVNPGAQQTLYNLSQFINLMWPYLYAPNPYEPEVDYAHSMAYAPVYSNGDKTVTITMKHYMWSDGQPVTAQDLVFQIELIKGAGANWGGYTPGEFPYNLTSYKATGEYTLQLQLNKAYNPTWFTDNQLGSLQPIPAQEWDRLSPTGKVGNYAATASGATAVWNMLNKQAEDTTTYTTNPLWKVIDGPWELQSYGGASTPDIFVPNPSYSGPKPYISKFEEIPFTSDSAEFTSLESGPSALTVGFIPSQDIPTRSTIQAKGYNVFPAYSWGVDYFIPNLKNPTYGPLLSQLYFRQVLQHLVDQTTMIKHFMFGYGIPTYGPTPVYPLGNPFATSVEKSNPYPFSVATAVSILKAHHWKVTPGGTDVCELGGASGCGAGVPTGQKLSLSLLYSSGSQVLDEETALYKSDAAQAGIQISLKSEPFGTVVGIVNPCLPGKATSPTCTWQLGEYGGISYSTEPTGGALFLPGGSLNAGSYDNPAVNTLIKEIHTSPTLKPYYQYEALLAKDLPWIWQPVPDGIVAVDSHLTGYGITGQFTGTGGYIEPQYWYFVK